MSKIQMRREEHHRPHKVKAVIHRTVKEIAIVTLDREGYIEEILDICDEVSDDELELERIIDVITFQ